jgi:hypothetical protein
VRFWLISSLETGLPTSSIIGNREAQPVDKRAKMQKLMKNDFAMMQALVLLKYPSAAYRYVQAVKGMS